ncbi:MAG TPA: hypothetical protein VJK02_02945 [Anaerolineales bacterium]|nr:hypothetical protein [Anaerolineales bacterium]
MPIVGITDRPAQFPEIGQIRKGAPKVEGEKKPGKDLTFFRVTFDDRETAASDIFVKRYGTQPTEIDVLLPFNSVEENFDAWREAYVAGGLIHRCDGERIWYEVDPKTGERLVTAGEPSKRCDGSAECKPVGRLRVLIPQLQRLAYLTVLTGSVHDILNLHRQLEALMQINGKLAGVPLKLRRRPIKISTPSGENGKRARREKWLLSIEADPEWVRHKLLAMKAAALPDNGLDEELPLLEAPDEPDDVEETVLDVQMSEPAEQLEFLPDPPPTNGNGGKATSTDFWKAVKAAGLDRDAGLAILKEAGGDFGRGLDAVATHVPPEEIPF